MFRDIANETLTSELQNLKRFSYYSWLVSKYMYSQVCRSLNSSEMCNHVSRHNRYGVLLGDKLLKSIINYNFT